MKFADNLILGIKFIIFDARTSAVCSVNFGRKLMYWKIGEPIFKDKQQGEQKAEYVACIIKSQAKVHEHDYRTVFSTKRLKRFRLFYCSLLDVSDIQTQFIWLKYKLFLD